MKGHKQARTTLKDIAQVCGYTANAVSRAMRNDERLPSETREKIQQTALQMGYIPNTLPSTLRSGSSRTVLSLLTI